MVNLSRIWNTQNDDNFSAAMEGTIFVDKYDFPEYKDNSPSNTEDAESLLNQ